MTLVNYANKGSLFKEIIGFPYDPGASSYA